MIKMYFKGKQNIPHKALARRGERRPTPCVLDAWFHTTVYRVVWHQQTDSASPDQVAGGKKGEDCEKGSSLEGSLPQGQCKHTSPRGRSAALTGASALGLRPTTRAGSTHLAAPWQP